MTIPWRLRRTSFLVKVLYDGMAWLVVTMLATGLRYDDPATAPWRTAALVAAALAAIDFLIGMMLHLHQGRARTGSLDEILLLACVAGSAGALVSVANLRDILIARTVPVDATLCFVVLAGFGRGVWRAWRESHPFTTRRTPSQRALVVGAGDGGRDLIVSMLRDPSACWNPVGLLDDDPAKRHLRVRGVPVLGDTHRMAEIVGSTGAEVIVVAIPSASANTVARIAQAGRATGAEVKVLPSTSELLRDHVGIRDIRDINLVDVLGRNQVDTDVASIAGYLTGRRVLVTGAGGSIGSELCRQISRFGPAELVMLDRDESALHAVQLSLTGRALLDSGDVVLCDIRDREAVAQVFMMRRPEVVFHAAALKHLPMLEQYPAEAVKTNVAGTQNVLDAADRAGVERLVNISTDKAANPTSVLGYSKRIAERLTAAHATRAHGTYLSVRFGNVLGSRGSVLTSFASQIASGGPVTVTHPEVTRFFMTIEEACQLVVQAGAIGRPGEALVLDMGDPIRIMDVARELIALQDGAVEIEFTGLREGEKLHEELFGPYEPRDVRPWHPLVSHVPVTPLSPAEVEHLPINGRRRDVVGALASVSADDSSCKGGRPGRLSADHVILRD